MKHTYVLVCTAFALCVGCGKKKEAGGADKAPPSGDKAPAGDKAGGDKAADPGAWKDLELPKLGLVANVPGNAKVNALGGISTADYKCGLDVFEVKDGATTFENWVENIEKGNKGGALKDMVKKEKTDDQTWVIAWTTETGKFGYAARRKVGDKAFDCVNFQAKSQEATDCATKICESLAAK